ncbi:hypothetical protein POTOM_005041 [Populus tomentosa]|uniref:Isochorismatase-like domain-containing protein n=1 Tax=Populus tomentosa TaxID=118781 RepID=A0A8X8AGL7_POPTO|nr:hypothetical protein POTOM_005041 [Populus tomentosa]
MFCELDHIWVLLHPVVREHDPQGRTVEVFHRHLYSPGNGGPTSKGSVGAELADGLVIKEGDYKLVKTRFSAFFATHLHSLLCTEGIKSLVMSGVRTPDCIRQTVFDAIAVDYQPVTVIFDPAAAATPDIHFARCGLIKSSISSGYHVSSSNMLFAILDLLSKTKKSFEGNKYPGDFYSGSWSLMVVIRARVVEFGDLGDGTPTLQEWCGSDALLTSRLNEELPLLVALAL